MKAKANFFRTLVVLWVVVVAVALALFGVGLRTAESQTTTPKMQVQDLGPLGGSRSYATGINDSGQVVGYLFTSDSAQHAFLYDASATPKMQDLGTLGGHDSRAMGINDSGQVVGWSYTNSGESHAFLYDSTNGMQDLNDLIPANSGETIYQASAINTDGKIAATIFRPMLDVGPNVCGQEYYNWGIYLAAVLTPATAGTPTTYEVQNLGTLGADYSEAASINGSGQVAGTSWNSYCWNHAFLYDSATQKMQDLGALGGNYSHATGINDSGQVVGYGDFIGSHAFLYDSATQKMQDLGDLEGGNWSLAMGINDSGQVVGRSYVGSGSYVSGSGRAFLYDSTNEMQNLNTLIPADSGWTIYEATAINTKGQIAATGHKEGVGTHALLLTPTSSDTPPPADTEAPSPPTITSPTDKTTTSNGTPTISGTAEANSTVTIYDGSTKLGTASTYNSGSWTFTPSSALSDGEHSLTATATDAAGNTSSASNSVTITVDKTAPTVTGVSPARGATKVARNTSVTATLSEKMDPKTLVTTPKDPTNPNVGTSTTFTLVKYGTTTPISATVSYDDSNNKVTLTPSFNLEARTKYTAKVGSGVKDLAGNALANAPYTWSFTTGS